MAQVPEVGWDVPSVLARARMFDRPITVQLELQDYLERQSFVHAVFARLQAEHDLRIVYPHEALCAEAVCSLTVAGRPLYYDTDHLSLVGTGVVTGLFSRMFERARAQAGDRP